MAELGDKTQLATLAVAASSRSRWAVFGGAALALVTITFLSVLVCEVLVKIVPVDYVKRAGGVVFILIGVALVLGR